MSPQGHCEDDHDNQQRSDVDAIIQTYIGIVLPGGQCLKSENARKNHREPGCTEELIAVRSNSQQSCTTKERNIATGSHNIPDTMVETGFDPLRNGEARAFVKEEIILEGEE